MRRLLSVMALVSMLGAVDVLGQDSNPPVTPPATPPVRTPREKPKPAEPAPSENPDEKKDGEPPTESKPGERPSEKPADKPGDKPGDTKSPVKQPAKPATKPATKPAPTQPSTAPGVTARPVIKVVETRPTEPGPFVRREKSKDWVVTINVDVQSTRSDMADPNNSKLPDTTPFKFETLSVVFPFPPATASAVPDRNSLKAVLKLQDRAVEPQKFTILEKQITGQPYQSGVNLIRMDAVNSVCREIGFEVSYKSNAYNTVYDEAGATKVDWPKNGWPTVVASTFGPQMYIDYAMMREPRQGRVIRHDFDTELLRAWVNEQTKGNPLGVPPATLAKWLAGQMMSRLQPTGDGLTYLKSGQLQGIGVLGPELTFQKGRGSDFDIAATLVAAYRMAGLPARLVIGWDTGTGSGSTDNFLNDGKGGKKTLKVWVEWALYDEAKGTLNWVPVDLARMRKQGSRAQSMDRAWKFFGTHDELQGVVPIALHFHPPTTVESFGAPGMWGWMMTPDPPEVGFQGLRIRADRASQTAEDQKKKREEK
ncbi:MAG: hypothetical protein JNL50_04485 [Phycisphaerae bacterium]|nr:hypothetical protein [Phycisphaerae bacterium]